MGIAAMVIGIVAVIFGFIPGCNYLALIPAIVGLILGAVDMNAKSKQQKPRGMAIAGVVLNIVAIVFILLWTLFFVAAAPVVVEVSNPPEQVQEQTDELPPPEESAQ